MSFMCPVCGFVGLKEKPPILESDWSTFEICKCCFVEFGCDAFYDNYRELRAKWIREGCPWGSKYTNPPKDWDAVRQMREAGFFSFPC